MVELHNIYSNFYHEDKIHTHTQIEFNEYSSRYELYKRNNFILYNVPLSIGCITFINCVCVFIECVCSKNDIWSKPISMMAFEFQMISKKPLINHQTVEK